MNPLFRPESEASAELEDAAVWYQGQRPGLGVEFVEAVDAALEQIARWPSIGRVVPGVPHDVPARRYILRLLRGSFRPADGIVALRGYLRHRTTLTESAGALVQRMQKALVQMNVQLPLVVSDITGVTGLRSSATSSLANTTRTSSPSIATTGVTRPRPRSSPL